MTFLFDVNNPTLTGPQAMYKMKQLLVSAGWVVKSSGDGLSAFSSSTDIITSGSSGANGWANTTAWVRIQSPAGAASREFMIQRSNSNTAWLINYSYSAGFSGGSPSATAAPTATDSQTIINTTLFNTDNNYRWNAMADTVSPYGFYMMTFDPGGTAPSSNPPGAAWMMEPMVAGSFSTLDVDPVVHYATNGQNWTNTDTTHQFAYLKKGLAGEGFVNVSWGHYTIPNNTIFPRGLGTDVYTGKFMLMPIIYARPTSLTAPVGWKGIGKMARWISMFATSPTLISVSTSKDFVCVGDVALPWNGSDILV
ncbi:MAG TPA: hypothetical protein VM577_18575 [Anaerovoracaceae bacterium]|nr:hypothetical protein [Anaerovoracaceae bacterium]